MKGGQFQLKAKVIDELGAFSVSEVNEENTTGVLNSVEKQSNTNFYPNPFNDCITFSLNENISGKVRLEIFTINGDLIWNTEITKLIHVPKIVSWTPDRRVTSGIYFSRITYEKNKKILSELGKIIYQN